MVRNGTARLHASLYVLPHRRDRDRGPSHATAVTNSREKASPPCLASSICSGRHTQHASWQEACSQPQLRAAECGSAAGQGPTGGVLDQGAQSPGRPAWHPLVRTAIRRDSHSGIDSGRCEDCHTRTTHIAGPSTPGCFAMIRERADVGHARRDQSARSSWMRMAEWPLALSQALPQPHASV
eukprot:COSAG01_NODE_10225_length_2216_cov_19.040151_3_plen_182_part_00